MRDSHCQIFSRFERWKQTRHPTTTPCGIHTDVEEKSKHNLTIRLRALVSNRSRGLKLAGRAALHAICQLSDSGASEKDIAPTPCI